MENPLFNKKLADGNPLDGLSSQLKSMGPSGIVFNRLYSSNPSFKQLADSLKGKTPEQAFRERGLDFSNYRNLKW